MAGLGLAIAVIWWTRRRRGVELLGAPPRTPLPDTRGPLYIAALVYIVVLLLGEAVFLRWLRSRGVEGAELHVFTTVHLGFALALLRYTGATAAPSRLGPARTLRVGVLAGLATFGVAAAIAVLVTAPYELVGIPTPKQELVEAARRMTGVDVVGSALLAVIVAPVAEEIFWRGILFPALARAAPIRMALAGQALAFGLIHVRFSGPGNLPLAIPLAAVGWAAGYVYWRTRSLPATILLHVTFNAINFAFLRLG